MNIRANTRRKRKEKENVKIKTKVAPQDIYNLKWNHFNGNLDFNLKELLFGNKVTDVTLVSDDKIAFKAHKFVLGACSPVLRDLLVKHFQSDPIVYLRGIHSYELEAILFYLYLGKT